jgi:hypothetical protein
MKTFIEYFNQIENNKSGTNSPYDYNHEFKKWTVFLEKKDACYYKVKSRYDVWPSAYGSGALVKCRKVGAANWGNSRKNETTELNEDIFKAEKEKGLRGWFDRNKGKGWIDCKASKKGKLVSCGRKKAGKGTERKYPACRPTLSACNKTGVKRKISKKAISWKKKILEMITSKIETIE